MKLMVVSHPCVTPINQQIYFEMEKQTGWSLLLATPSNWRDEYGNVRRVERWPGLKGTLLPIPVWLTGNIPLHIYRSWMRDVMLQFKPDVVYVNHEPYAAATAQVYLANSASIRKPIGFYSCQNIAKQYPIPFRWSERMVYRRSAFALPVSTTVDTTLRQKGYRGETKVLPFGIDPEIYRPHPEAQGLRAEFTGPAKEIIIGYLGRMIEAKGLGTLLRALEKLKALPWRLVLVGTGPYESEARAQAELLGISDRVVWTGYIPHADAPRYLSAFDVLVLPSETRSNWKEQFGRVLIEALACGTPVIGSSSGEIPHVIQDTGGGFVFAEGQSDDLANQLRRLLTEPELRQQLAKKGQQTVLGSYTQEGLAGRLAGVLERAALGRT